MSGALPAGVSEQQMRAALEQFRTVVGSEWVFSDVALNPYLDPYPTTENPDQSNRPFAAVSAASTEDVQAIVRIANEYKIPLWPISRGKNHAYGGAAPVLSGTVILDMSRMNRILEVSEEYAYALVEPGVSYFDLYEHIQKRGLKLWIDVPDPGWGSVMGNALDHGVGYTPYGDHFGMQCGMEVVLPNGELIRTGMGAMPGNNTWQMFKYGFGPYVDGMFSQSNFGIVTKMGVWLMPEPPGYRPYMITFEREEDIYDIAEILRPLKIGGVIQNAATVRNLILDAAITTTKSKYYQGKGPVPDSVARKMMKDLDLGMWNFCGALYGPPPMMDALWEIIRDSFAKISGAKFYFPEDRRHKFDLLKHRAETMRGIPKLTEYNFVSWGGGTAHLGFSPVSALNGDDALKQVRMVSSRVKEYGFDYMSLLAVGWRDMHHVSLLVYDKHNPEERRKVDELFKILIEEAAAEGYGEYRTHINYMDRIARTYGWNDGALWKFHHMIKDAVDPNGIIAPGKSGIWPQRWRQ